MGAARGPLDAGPPARGGLGAGDPRAAHFGSARPEVILAPALATAGDPAHQLSPSTGTPEQRELHLPRVEVRDTLDGATVVEKDAVDARPLDDTAGDRAPKRHLDEQDVVSGAPAVDPRREIGHGGEGTTESLASRLPTRRGPGPRGDHSDLRAQDFDELVELRASTRPPLGEGGDPVGICTKLPGAAVDDDALHYSSI